MCAARSALIALACTWFTGVCAQAPEVPQGPDLEFLEYLGAWAEEDDEWIAIEEWEKDAAPDDDRDASGQQEDGDDEDE